MAVCCICNKPRVFTFSPPLLKCQICGLSYHIDCHQPPLDSDTTTEFKCTSCTRIVRDRVSEKPPRKRSKIERSNCEEPNPGLSIDNPQAAQDGYRDHRITKRDAVNLLRQRNPNDRQLSELLDRYLNKTASRGEREVIREKIHGIARELVNRSLGSYTRTISPPQSAKKPTTSPRANVTSQDLHSADVQAPHEIQGDVLETDKAPQPFGLKSSQVSTHNDSSVTISQGRLSSTMPSITYIDTHDPPEVIDLTNDDERLIDREHYHPSPEELNEWAPSPEPYGVQAISNEEVKFWGPTDCAQGNATSLASGESKAIHQRHDELREEHESLLNRIKEMWQRIEVLESMKSSASSTIDELRAEVSMLKSQLSLAKQELRTKQPIETSLQPDHSSIILPIRNSQGDHPPTFLSPESETHSPTLPDLVPDEPDKEEAHVQSQLLKEQLTVYEQRQKIQRLERELEEVKAGKQIPMARIAHLNLLTGGPFGIEEALSGKQPSRSPRLSRKEASSRINMHRANESRTHLQVEPLRWNARDQSSRFRQKVDYRGVDGSSDQSQVRGRQGGKKQKSTQQPGHMLNSPADSNPSASGDDDTDLVDHNFHDDDPKHGQGVSAATKDLIEIPNSSNEPSGASEEGERSRPTTRASSRLGRVEEKDGGSEIGRVPTPDAVKAARTFERAFEIDSTAMPVVVEARLAFRTGDGVRASRSRAAQNDLYRVGRDVLGEMR